MQSIVGTVKVRCTAANTQKLHSLLNFSLSVIISVIISRDFCHTRPR